MLADTHTPATGALRWAAHAVDNAIGALRAEPGSVAVADALRRADTAVAALPAGLVSTILNRLLDTAWDCHRAGADSSARLVAQRGAAARAMRLAS
ncbi:hypothetical protein [Pseudonocardia sp. N23]|uniref:hypothetical protein n=1 Tax=Pseudonocardia sp. N23 TaxID=1987376 RepID=UPI000C037CDC|nr:hypothetical protein [Pseudonocardia sp. N23]GAY09141.1 hypothetical protein TOK_3097 [Pseudonocardia sp. N23]